MKSPILSAVFSDSVTADEINNQEFLTPVNHLSNSQSINTVSGRYRLGMLKIRYKLKELNRQRQINSKTGIEAMLLKDLIVKENRKNSEQKMNTKNKEIKTNYWFLVILVVLLLLYRKGSFNK